MDCHFGNAARAALTAASMSADDPCATLASFSPVEGSVVSKYSPAEGSRHVPSVKCPNRRECWSSQLSASFASSGAGPYSIAANFSAMLIVFGKTKQWDDDSPPSNDRSRDTPVAAQYHLRVHWLQGGRVLPSSRRGQVPLSLGTAIPGIAWQSECRPQP